MEVRLTEVVQIPIIVERQANHRITAITAVVADIMLGVVTLAVVAGTEYPAEVVAAMSKLTIPEVRRPAIRAHQIDINLVDQKNTTNAPITYI